MFVQYVTKMHKKPKIRRGSGLDDSNILEKSELHRETDALLLHVDGDDLIPQKAAGDLLQQNRLPLLGDEGQTVRHGRGADDVCRLADMAQKIAQTHGRTERIAVGMGVAEQQIIVVGLQPARSLFACHERAGGCGGISHRIRPPRLWLPRLRQLRRLRVPCARQNGGYHPARTDRGGWS